jgi:hypothetical protein
LASDLAENAWDWAYGLRPPKTWSPSFENANTTEGIVTLGGGSIRADVGGCFLAQTGTFSKGDLAIYAGSHLYGRFLVKEGTGSLVGLGNAGSSLQPLAIESFDARVSVSASGSLVLGTAINPTIVRDQFAGAGWNLQYTESSSLRLRSFGDDVVVLGKNSEQQSFYSHLSDFQKYLLRILSPTLEVYAGRDILLANNFALVPSPSGNLILDAGRHIDGLYKLKVGASATPQRSLISMSDMNSADVYGRQKSPGSELFSQFTHSIVPMHMEDLQPVTIKAKGDIKNIQLYLPKKAEVQAGRDILDIYLVGQNLHTADVTRIISERDISFGGWKESNSLSGIQLGGPGLLTLISGNQIDLGTSKGISTFGNAFNPVLGSKGSDLLVVSGYMLSAESSYAEMSRFFAELQVGGDRYSRLLNSGDTAGARSEIDRIREELIRPPLADARSGSGVIEMTSSQISTSSGPDNLLVIAGGAINVGQTAFFSEEQRLKMLERGGPESTGIYTAAGGAISIYSEGDINVNESRVMTFRGGDITLWSNQGDINAGRGSKTAINVDPPKVELIGDQYVLVFRPPAVGSGIRAVTYDPDGIEGPLLEPPPGDIFAFAPQGVIDAGEAGIAGGNVTLGATAVLNAQNISFAFGSVGVPEAGGVSTGIGALAGAGSVSETAQIAQESSSLKSAEERMAKFTEELNKYLVPKIIMVEVMGFEEEKVN